MGAPICLSLPLLSVATRRTMAGTSGESGDEVAVVIFWGQVLTLDWHLLSACPSLLLKVAFNLDALGASPVTGGVTQMLPILSPSALPWGTLISLCL